MKRFFCVGLAVMMAFSLAGCGDSGVKATPPAPSVAVEPTPTPEAAPSPEVELPEYSVISSSEYMRDGKDCIGYRVEIADGTSKDDMRNVFKAVTKDDKYFLHTVWFYGLASDVDTVGAYTVGMLEEETVDDRARKTPVFTESAVVGETLDKLRGTAATDSANP